MPLTHDIGVRIPYPLRRTIATAVVFHFLRDGAGSRTGISAQDSDKRSLRRRNDEKHVSPNATFEERRGAPPIRQDERPEAPAVRLLRETPSRPPPNDHAKKSVNVTLPSTLEVRRSDPPCSCMMRRERLSPMPDGQHRPEGDLHATDRIAGRRHPG